MQKALVSQNFVENSFISLNARKSTHIYKHSTHKQFRQAYEKRMFAFEFYYISTIHIHAAYSYGLSRILH